MGAFQAVLLFSVVSLVVGVVFSQRIKDFFTGVPSDVRTALNQVEANVLAHISTIQSTVVANVKGALVTPPPISVVVATGPVPGAPSVKSVTSVPTGVT